MDEFLQVFGDMKVATVVIILVALGFVYKLYTVSKNHLIEKYKKEEERERKIQKVIEQAEKYPEWHKQSLDVQKQFSDAIAAIKEDQSKTSKQLERLTTQIGENEATVCRYRILRFNDEILHEQKHTQEHFDQILDDVTKYEKYCDEHPEYENNKAVLAIENVKRIYRKCSDENLFL